MVWGCMSARGVGNLKFIDGTIIAQKYVNILEENLLPSINYLSDNGEFIFQQDGASSHTTKITKKYLESREINVLNCPSSSPDLNPIESHQNNEEKDSKRPAKYCHKFKEKTH